MLVLSRKRGEVIAIGDDVTITISAIQGDRVHVNIDAQKSVRIRRGELRPFPQRAQSITIPPAPRKGDEVATSTSDASNGVKPCVT